MNIFLIFTNGILGLKKLRLKKLFILLFVFWNYGRLLERLYLAMDDLIDWKIGMLVFDILLFVCLLLCIELLPLCYFQHFFIVIGIILDIVFEPYLHILHPSIEITYLSYFLFLPLDVSHFE